MGLQTIWVNHILAKIMKQTKYSLIHVCEGDDHKKWCCTRKIQIILILIFYIKIKRMSQKIFHQHNMQATAYNRIDMKHWPTKFVLHTKSYILGFIWKHIDRNTNFVRHLVVTVSGKVGYLLAQILRQWKLLSSGSNVMQRGKSQPKPQRNISPPCSCYCLLNCSFVIVFDPEFGRDIFPYQNTQRYMLCITKQIRFQSCEKLKSNVIVNVLQSVPPTLFSPKW
jgi:hypothetical protein